MSNGICALHQRAGEIDPSTVLTGTEKETETDLLPFRNRDLTEHLEERYQDIPIDNKTR